MGNKRNILFIVLLSLVTLTMSIGYASSNSIVLEIIGQSNALPYPGVLIYSVDYLKKSENDNTTSTINNFIETTINATINLDNDVNDYEIYQISIKNNDSEPFIYLGMQYDSEFFSVPNDLIEFVEESSGLETISVGDIIPPNSTKVFRVKFKYVDGANVGSDNTLSCIINFRFSKKNIQVIFNANNGLIPVSQTGEWVGSGETVSKLKALGETYGELPIPTRTGYTFIGWTLGEYLLADGYREVEYLESTGSQYINTSIKINKDDIIKTISSTNSAGNYHTIVASTGYFELYYNIPRVEAWSGIKIVSGQTTNISAGEVYYTESKVTVDAGNLEIFSYRNSYNLYGKVYSVIVLRNNEEIVNLIPCINLSNNLYGMYDVINRVFYQGTGTFNAGLEINNTVDSSTIIENEANKSLVAVWSGNKHNVTLDNGLSNYTNQVINATYGSYLSNISLIERQGYLFDGYYSGQNGTGTKYYDNTGKCIKKWDIDSDTTLYANWLVDGYTITLDVNGGDSLETNTIIVNYGDSIGQLPTPTYGDHQFLGWYYKLVPDTYQQVEYLESEGNQYITTNSKAKVNDVFRTVSSASATGNYLTIVSATNQFELYYNIPNVSVWKNARITSGKTQNVALNEVITHEITITSEPSNSGNVEMFSYSNNYKLFGRIYSVDWLRENKLYASFVPCYRKSDNKTGMYDKTNQTFYPNKATAEFGLGNTVENDTALLSSNEIYMLYHDITLVAKWDI